MHCATSEMLRELIGSGSKASQNFYGKVGLVPLFLDLTFVPKKALINSYSEAAESFLSSQLNGRQHAVIATVVIKY